MIVVGKIPGRSVPGRRHDDSRVWHERLGLAGAVDRCRLEATRSSKGDAVTPGGPCRKRSPDDTLPRTILKIDQVDLSAAHIEQRAAAIGRQIQMGVIETLA